MIRPDQFNTGVVVRAGLDPSNQRERDQTFIISGVPRGGITMIVRVLREAGVYFEANSLNHSYEDTEMQAVLRKRDYTALDILIARRNACGIAWSFDVPMPSAFIGISDLQRFRNPHLIIVFRDPVAVAIDSSKADNESPLDAFSSAMEAMEEITRLVDETYYPALMLSYESCIRSPEYVIDAVMSFCNFGNDTGLRQRLLKQLEANNDSGEANVGFQT